MTVGVDGQRIALMHVRVPFYPIEQPWTSRPLPVAAPDGYAVYFEALTREVGARAASYADVRIPALWLGGGVVDGAAADSVGALLSRVRELYDLQPDAEIVLEVHPGWVTPALLDTCADVGITRLAVDMVSASAAEARELGYSVDPDDAQRGLACLGNAACQIGVRLLAGIPGQTVRTGVESVEAALALGACEVDVRPFLLDPDTVLARSRIERDDAWRQQAVHRLPSTVERTQIRTAMGARLASDGFVEYLPGMWAMPGCEGGYQRLRSAGCDVLGFGLGARTKYDDVVHANTGDLGLYLEAAGDPARCVVESYRAVAP